ncbi:serine hydrolase [Mycobacterium haemophilum]|uniref:Beta-lactamase n=1 Tax=Mycobacterium haemophilum TaxID=29311 RepID=A0A0I9ZS32_9MYCO|nr:serine hydrolase [Mycobacterium haemophilum]KLO29868.1 beta-lactamase [Mycobacterium haemophilum]KLO38450.1 beta-lactamase [Mycobacterium haemophilum]KLO44784.1 beta-lactamase [Mycobacterium haemophilum]KLO56127.1 beta-lactamase [Mycobacterium haemophilum]
MNEVSRQIQAVFTDAGCRGWLQARPVSTVEPAINFRADEPVPTASIYKVLLLAAVARSFDRGELDPSARVTIRPTDCTPGPTGFSTFIDPVTVSWRDLARSMIVLSDNAAADILLAAVGLPRMDEIIDELGLASTHVIGGAAALYEQLIHDMGAQTLDEAISALGNSDTANSLSIYDPDQTNATSAADSNTILAAIWTNTIASPHACSYMRGVLAQQVWPHRIKSGFPQREISVAGKTGTIGKIRSEVAVISLPNETPIAVSVFTHAARSEHSLPAVDRAIGTAARIAVTAVRTGS